MGRRMLFVIAGVAAAALLATGVVAGMLITEDNDGSDRRSTIATPTVEGTTGTSTPARAYLGLETAVVSGNGGLRVTAIIAGSPADEAALEVGDILRSIDGQVVRTPEQLRSAVEAHKPGDRVNLTYERSDREARVEVRLADQPANAQAQSTATPSARPSTTPTPSAQTQGQANRGGRLGVTVQQITPALKQRYGITRDSGIVITEVASNSTAARAGLQAGDVILSVNSKTVNSTNELQRVLLSIGANEMAAINIQRKDEQKTIETRLPAQNNLDGIAELIPDEIYRMLQESIIRGAIQPEQLQNLLRLFQTRGDFVQVGRVKSVNPGVVSGTWIVTLAPENGTSEVAVNTNSRTEIKRGATTIQPGDLKENELIIAISLDTNRTATQIIATGSTN